MGSRGFLKEAASGPEEPGETGRIFAGGRHSKLREQCAKGKEMEGPQRLVGVSPVSLEGGIMEGMSGGG